MEPQHIAPKLLIAESIEPEYSSAFVEHVFSIAINPHRQQLKDGHIDLNDPAVTLALLKLNSIVGVTGRFEQNGSLKSVGIQCALCHSAVDNSLIAGIGHRLDGWANRDLDVGSIIALAPNLEPIAKLLGVDEATVRKVLHGWGPGRFDAELELDGKGFRPDGKTSAVLIPPAFGLAGVNLHTWTGWGSVPPLECFRLSSRNARARLGRCDTVSSCGKKSPRSPQQYA